MLAATATLISVLSAVVGVAGLLAYLYSLRRTEHSSARDEALALAEMRRQMVTELRSRLELVEQRRDRTRESLACIRDDLNTVPPDVERALATIRELLAD